MNEQDIREAIGVAVESTLVQPAPNAASPWATLVEADGTTLYQGCSGKTGEGQVIDWDTLFDLGTLSELFTLTAFLKMIDEGRLWLDTPVSVLLPELPDTMRFLDLLTHRSGLAPTTNFGRLPNPEQRLQSLETLAPETPPDRLTVPRYSPYDFMLIGLALEALTDLPLEIALAQVLFQPLGLAATFLPLPLHAAVVTPNSPRREPFNADARALNHVSGHNGLFATAMDILKVARLYLPVPPRDNPYADAGFLSGPVAQEALKEHLPGQGFGWVLRPHTDPGSADRAAFYQGETGCMVVLDSRKRAILVTLTDRAYGPQAGGQNPDDFVNSLPRTVLSLIE
jgi:CubicO group peptidase (beta-lactamase class C family)